ncbi:MAG: hypothetical protein JSV04_12910 [Candidatus Heimdallarchaeota archaeon]|nr:MAG: hypothetical protein JSV04_12910 [Candidatus Heimdallarchaeota archaeon]
MITSTFFWIRFFLDIIMLICAYVYSVKVYGVKITTITSLLITSFFLVILFSGAYASVPLGTDLPFYATIGAYTDMIGIFPSFLITFELGRYALRKTNDINLTYTDIVYVNLLVAFFGICFQIVLDDSAAGLGLYYYTDPPTINIFGYPIYFLLSFTIYGVWGAIFLLLEKKYSRIGLIDPEV